MSYSIKCLLHWRDLGVCKVQGICFEKGLLKEFQRAPLHTNGTSSVLQMRGWQLCFVQASRRFVTFTDLSSQVWRTRQISSNSNRMEIAFNVKLSKGNFLHLFLHVFDIWIVLLSRKKRDLSSNKKHHLFSRHLPQHEQTCKWLVMFKVSTRGHYKPSMSYLKSLILLSKLTKALPLSNRLSLLCWNVQLFLEIIHSEC